MGFPNWGVDHFPNFLGADFNWDAWQLGAAGLCYFFLKPESGSYVSLTVLATMLSIAIIGEILEFAASSLGVNRLGGSKKGGILAVVGSVIGAIVGIFIGIPIPIVGSLVAAVLFGCCGAFAGAIVGEYWDGKDWDDAIKIGWGAFWGRFFGTILKTLCGTILLVILIVSVWTELF